MEPLLGSSVLSDAAARSGKNRQVDGPTTSLVNPQRALYPS